jgi:hypothetical protein
MSSATPWSDPTLYRKMNNIESENARLKADVERLQNNCDYLDQKLDEEIDKSAMLCGQIHRLVKAGDAVALDYAERIEIEAGRTPKVLMKIVPVLREWVAAKKGNPTPTE